MKLNLFITLITVFSSSGLCSEYAPELLKHLRECVKENNISPEELQGYLDGKLAPTEEFKCSVHCAMIKRGIMDESGSFKPDIAKSRMPNDDEFAAVVDTCKNVSGSSLCDTAFEIANCFRSKKEKDN